MTLSTKHQLFVQEYLKDLNASAAARRAGYAVANANCRGSELLKEPEIQEAIAQAAAARLSRLQIEADDVLREILALATVDLAAAYDEKGNLLSIHEMPVAVRKAIAGVEVLEEFQGRGAQREHIGSTRKVKMWDRLKALELLGRHLALFNDKLDVNLKGDVATRILQARKRGQPDDGSDLV
jgi:phage terminase small subunit